MRDQVDPADLVELTRQLVAIDTRNPPGNERAATGVMREALAPFATKIDEFEVASDRTSLLATIGDDDPDRPTLIVNGHLDVVPVDPNGWTHDPFGGELEDGRLYGRGTADMKGGIAAAVEALATLRRAGAEPSCNLAFHLVADEERGGALGAEAMVAAGMVRGDACLVPEPTSLQLCVAERGLFTATITVTGRPAHGSEPARGVSAIEKAAKLVLTLHGADFGDRAHPLLGTPTCNVGVIDGGTGHNTVAEQCHLVIDRRLLPGMTRQDAEQSVRSRLATVDDPDLRWSLEPGVYGEASELDPTHPFVGQVQRSLKAVMGEEMPVIGMVFSTDARFVRNQAGIPAVVCGPGGIEQAHVHDEWVAVDRLIDAAAVYAELFATFTA